MSLFAKGDKTVKVISVMGSETATVETIASVKAGIARIEDSSLTYDATTGREVDVAPGFAAAGIGSRLIVLEE